MEVWMKLRLVLILFILANIADFAWTFFYLSIGIPELNPFLKLLMQKIGVLPAMILLKLVALIGALFIYGVAEERLPTKGESRHARLAFLALTAISLIVVMWHLWGFSRLVC
ncbi:MAG TPA: hypothetical protein DCS06_03320 [Candidatus Yanofskybacteria bacterium]|nr:MAG: hypothetical protein A2207_01235 [Candidatus Yanofskybacteria bacterium RIFOXYA1_FULL_44_17]OGN38388.1 MAG: hypothetical protein A2405_01505 [Candidatus Yanofskybacteria bacterium RIFOXYC1_FULL_44_16]OGN38745.1 MAG: hypothetical protein A2371_03305 [Candidatus Yanofskybacteria bacterium RIFOXYB1_FULL_44_29]OGN39878.1 MAG: hypothetical protein A2457_03135 [Candidatus Yanofskybacteria bacterium RIFOXYC2_FULL_44_13]HAU07980.1 hypothetical protein [Candidatus Yanofskybacteria bacterium]